MATNTGWTREQLLVALSLYWQMPFGRMHFRNPEIIRYAGLIGRTPSALAMKLTNIASLDQAITSTGRSGLRNASSADRAMWEEMQADWGRFAVEAQKTVGALGDGPLVEAAVHEIGVSDEIADYSGGDKTVETTARVGQDFFRRAVLSAYDYQCCITGLTVPTLLVASHIVPWRVDEKNRLNPKNGLCLSALHDRSFDAGIITIAEDLTVRVSSQYGAKGDPFFKSALSAYDGKPIARSEKFRPDEAFLAYHRQHVFQG